MLIDAGAILVGVLRPADTTISKMVHFPLCTSDRRIRKKQGRHAAPFPNVAEWTGLEPATPGVTGRYSNQLNYHSATFTETTALRPVVLAKFPRLGLVGAEGFEPPTLAL